MAVFVGFFIFFISSVSLTSSQLLRTTSTTTTTTPANGPGSIWPCINDELKAVQSDFTEWVKSLNAEGICGSDTINNFKQELNKTSTDFQKCTEFNCYMNYLPVIKNEIMAAGIQCTESFMKNGPFMQQLNRVYDTIYKCIIQPNA